MPFTFSHPAAVLPLAYLPKKWVSVSGLVIGAITPDFEYFFRMKQLKTISHTWLGMFYFDLPLGLILLFIFNLFVRDALIDHLPLFLNRRLSRFKSIAGKKLIQKNIIIIILSLLVGIISHLIWDRLTHKTVALVEEHWEDFYAIFWDTNSLIGAALIGFSIYKLPKGKATMKTNMFQFWSLLLIIAIAVMSLHIPRAKYFRELGIPFISGSLLGLIITSVVEKIRNTKATQA